MEIAGFAFTVGELEGYRFIESVFPETFDQRRLWAAASSYPTFWDETTPTVTLNDLTHMGPLTEEARTVLMWVLQQNSVRANLVATSWVTGGNEEIAEQIRSVLVGVGRPLDTIFATREEAIAYLRARIAEARASAG